MFDLLRKLIQKLFRPKSEWDTYDYGKPSTAGDDFRKSNDV